ncbi:hypothetical protein QJS10_CPB15g01448 [Acorus calamus]|uniref:Uncharacterized protein n=1 Tax=Acorus calamus TaxID=4465 RepID=A0AAV9D5T1_ACOCL|nr:hypothetical protein QJS10_CPB15g01448 [Acorus calamus]
MFGNVPLQGVGSAALPDSLQNSNPLPTNLQFQEFQGIREQSDWQGNLQENNTVPTGLSQSHVDLDPTEEKLLFSADDDNWDASLGRSSNINADGSDILNMFPSIQSGSWSALMQSAVAEASSGDMGLQDEWSGLSFQKIDPAAVIQPTVLNDSGKQQVAWVEDNLQTAVSVTSKPFPLFGDASPSTSGRAGPAYPCEPSDREHTDASHESHSPKHIGMQSNQSLQQRSLGGPTIHNSQQRSFGEASLRAPMHLENTPQNNLARQMYEQSLSTECSAEMESLARQQSIPSSNFSGQSFSKPNGWNINEALSPIAGTTLKGQVNENIDQHAQRYDLQRAMRTEGDPNGTMWRTIDRNRLGVPFPGSPRGLESTKSSFGSPQVQMDDSYKHNLSAFYSKTSEEQQVPNAFHIGHGKRRPVDSSSKHRGNEVMGEYQQLSSKGMQVWKSSVETTDRVSSEEHSKKRDDSSLKEVSHDSNISNRFHPRQGEGTKENSVDSGAGECHLAIGTQNSSGKVGQKSTIHRKFHYHPMGNLGADTEPTEYSKHVTYPQGLPHYGSGAHGSQDQGNSGPSKFANHFVSNGTMDMEMEHSTNLQRNMKAKDSLSRSTTSVYNSGTSGSFSGSATIASPNERTVHASQNMLELLHKVEHSRDGDNVSCFDSSDGNPYDALAPVQHHQASVVKGFGLRLGPPSQRLPCSTKDLSSKSAMQTVTDQNTLNMEGGNKDLGRMASLQSLSPSQGISQRDNQDVKLNLAGQTGNGPSYLSSQGHTLTAVSSPYPRNQQQILNVSSPSGQISTDQSANLFVSRGDPNAHAHAHAHAHSAYLRQAPEPHSPSGTVTNQPTQVPPPSVASRMSPFRIPSSAESHVSIPTRLHIGNASHSQTQNVWTNVSAQQRLSGMPPHKMSPTVQSISSSSSGLGTVSQASQKKDDEITKKVGDTSSEFGTCFVNSQQVGYGEEQPGRYASLQQVPSEMVDPSSQMTGVCKVQEPGSKQPLDENSVASMSPAVRRYQQDICKGKHVQMPTQMGHVSLQNIAPPNHDSVASGHKLTLSDVPHLNYSLLQQMQSMKGSEADPNWRLGKRLKEGAHSSNDIQDMAIRAGQRIMYGTGAQRTSFPSDVKMLNFSSEGREDQNATAPVQQQGFVASGRNDSQSIPHSLESIERSKISLQMAPSWFEQYGSKNGQILASYQGLGGSQKTAKAVAQQYFFTKVSESMGTQSFAEQRNETDQISRVWQSTPSAIIVHNNLSSHDSQLRNDDTVAAVRPKKRKSAASDLLPWHKKVTGVFQRPQSLSMAEVDWAQAANRRIEKLEDEADITEDGSLMPRSRRRLILTTQLMQQIVPPLSTVILKADAFKEYENVTYSAAKLALGDVCCLISHSRSDPRVDPESENTVLVSEKLKSYERPGDEFLSKVVEGFIGKAKKLEVDLLRLDKRTSLLDIRLECQELEKFSIINRFAKIFNRGNPDGVENPSSSDIHTRKAFPQRYVTALAMPGNLPDGVVCLSL